MKLAIALLTVVLAGCSSGGSKAATQYVDHRKLSTTPKAQGIADRLQSAGVDCHGQQLVGDVDCTYKGQRVTVSTSSWSATEAQRRKACKQGYINTGYVVAIDGDRLSISADQNDTTQAIAKAMHLDVVTYCPDS